MASKPQLLASQYPHALLCNFVVSYHSDSRLCMWLALANGMLTNVMSLEVWKNKIKASVLPLSLLLLSDGHETMPRPAWELVWAGQVEGWERLVGTTAMRRTAQLSQQISLQPADPQTWKRGQLWSAEPRPAPQLTTDSWASPPEARIALLTHRLVSNKKLL